MCRGVADARVPVRVGVWLCIELCNHEVPMQSLQIPCVGHPGSKRQEEDEREGVGPECGQEQALVAELC